ncbi:MAG: hypothetical protein CMJ16_00455 [Peredibacter sp.]|nr:hypothetical protein [Peredibacter sp.]
MNLWTFAKKHKGMVTFGFCTTFFVGIGQTFLVAQFSPFIQEGLSISRTDISFVYSLATFIASFNLTYIGSLLDRMSLLRYFFIVATLICAGLLTISQATNIVALFVGFYLLRGFGQVPLGLMATTVAARWFGKHRGKLLTLIGFGRSLSEGVLPFLSIIFIESFGWRNSLIGIMLVFLIIMVPVALYFIPKTPKKALYEENVKTADKEQVVWGWRKAVGHKWPMLLMINNALIPFILTALFFQQDSLAQFKGWNMRTMAQSFIAFSAVHICGNIFWGPLVDRVTAKKVLPFTLIPFLLGLLCLYFIQASWGAFAYMGLVGLSVGVSGIVRNAFWAEVYGLLVLGKMKGMDSNVIVIGTSLAPIFYAKILELGIGVEQILQIFIGLTLLGICNHVFISRHYNR